MSDKRERNEPKVFARCKRQRMNTISDFMPILNTIDKRMSMYTAYSKLTDVYNDIDDGMLEDILALEQVCRRFQSNPMIHRISDRTLGNFILFLTCDDVLTHMFSYLDLDTAYTLYMTRNKKLMSALIRTFGYYSRYEPRFFIGVIKLQIQRLNWQRSLQKSTKLTIVHTDIFTIEFLPFKRIFPIDHIVMETHGARKTDLPAATFHRLFKPESCINNFTHICVNDHDNAHKKIKDYFYKFKGWRFDKWLRRFVRPCETPEIEQSQYNVILE
jgi:hypothetical protein